MITWPLSTNPPTGASLIGIRDWAPELDRHRRLCEILPSHLLHVITMPWNACHTSGPPLHVQLSPTHPRGIAAINRARGLCVVICGPQLDTTHDTPPRRGLWSLQMQYPREAPSLPFLWVLRSGQHAEIAPDLHATAAEKRDPFDRLQRRWYRPCAFHLSWNSEHKDLLKSWALENRKAEGGISITRCVGVSVPGQYLTQETAQAITKREYVPGHF